MPENELQYQNSVLRIQFAIVGTPKQSHLSMLRSSLHCSFTCGSSSSLDCLTVMPFANTVSTRNLQGWGYKKKG